MLEGLDAIDWNRLRHCYGPAGDVPDQLRALASPDPARRQWARGKLFGNIYHQGGTYEASAYAVPFLLELLAEPATPDREYLLALLDGLAVGSDEFVLPHGTSEHHDEVPSYVAVAEGVPLFRRVLWEDDGELAARAAKLLGWFPRHADGSIPALWARCGDGPPNLAASCLTAIGLLGTRGDRGLIGRLEPLLHDPDERRRWGAAIALARVAGDDPPPGTLETLLRDACGAVPELVDDETLVINDGFMRSYAASSFQLVGPAVRPAAVAMLIDALARSGRDTGVWLAEGLMATAFDRWPAPGDTPFTALEPLQQQALRGLFGAPWFVPGHRAEYLLTRYGFPGDPRELEDYIRGRRSTATRRRGAAWRRRWR